MLSVKKTAFFIFWFIGLFVPLFTLFANTSIVPLKANQVLLINVVQRAVGLMAFVLLFYQIILGAFMKKWTQILGAWLFRFHLFEGTIAYFLVLLHPVMYVLVNYKIRGTFDPFYVFTEACALCSNTYEIYLTFGRLAFWMVTAAIIAAKFRTLYPLRADWRKFHFLNYVAFFFVAFHSWNVGSDVRLQPFYWQFYLFLVLASLVLAYRVFRFFRKS